MRQAEGKLQAAAHAQTAAVEELASRLDQSGNPEDWKEVWRGEGELFFVFKVLFV